VRPHGRERERANPSEKEVQRDPQENYFFPDDLEAQIAAFVDD